MTTSIRRRHAAAVGLAVLAGLVPAVASAAAAAHAAAESWDALLSGQPAEVGEELRREGIAVLDDDDGATSVLVVFASPLDSVMQLLSETGRQREYRTDLAGGTATLAASADGALERQHMRYFVIDLVVHLRYRVDRGHHRIEWALDPAYENDLDRVEGSWELHAASAGTTLGRFRTVVDLGTPLPRFLRIATIRGDVDAVRRWVDSGGTWRP